MAEPVENQMPKLIVQDHTSPGQLRLPFRLRPRPIIHEDDKPYPLRVKYFVKSYRFPKFIWPGTGIEENMGAVTQFQLKMGLTPAVDS